MSVEELEKLRIKTKNNIIKGILISLVVSIIFLIVFNEGFVVFFVLSLGIIITAIVTAKPLKEFKLAFKDIFVKKSLDAVFTDLVYEPEKGLDESIISDTNMMYMGDRYTSNDYISGKYKNVNFIQADVHIEEEQTTTDSDGNTTTTWITLFRGRWMVFDFNKTFKANVQVSQKRFGNSKISNWGENIKYKKVMMEDQEFNNNFRVYAQSEHDAFYILTPSLMEKIKRLSTSISGKLLFCFIDNKLHIGLQNNKDSFEHSIFTKINEEEVINNISQDIKLITSFVDELSLDNDLFRKEV